MNCRYRNRRWKIVYFYIGAIGHVRKRIPGLYGKNAREKKLKKMKRKSSMKKYVMYQDVDLYRKRRMKKVSLYNCTALYSTSTWHQKHNFFKRYSIDFPAHFSCTERRSLLTSFYISMFALWSAKGIDKTYILYRSHHQSMFLAFYSNNSSMD